MFQFHYLGQFLADTCEILQRVHRIELAHFPWIDTVQSHLSKSIEAEFGVIPGIEKCSPEVLRKGDRFPIRVPRD